jgi:hypothetical protein
VTTVINGRVALFCPSRYFVRFTELLPAGRFLVPGQLGRSPRPGAGTASSSPALGYTAPSSARSSRQRRRSFANSCRSSLGGSEPGFSGSFASRRWVASSPSLRAVATSCDRRRRPAWGARLSTRVAKRPRRSRCSAGRCVLRLHLELKAYQQCASQHTFQLLTKRLGRFAEWTAARYSLKPSTPVPSPPASFLISFAIASSSGIRQQAGASVGSTWADNDAISTFHQTQDMTGVWVCRAL